MMRRWAPWVSAWLVLCSACAATVEPPVDPGSVPVVVAAVPPSGAPGAVGAVGAPIEVPTGPVAPAQSTWIGAAPSQTVIVPGTGAWIGVWIGAPEAAPANVSRPPMNLALVVDTSGSMSGPKIENARLAATSLLEGLVAGDMVSIDAFSDTLHPIAPPTRVSPASLGSLMSAVRGLEAMGGTNMYVGLDAGTRNAASSPAHPLRRVIMISDGLANVGPSSPQQLGDLAARGTEQGVQVSAIGVGLDYDERTLGELARRSSGRMYHLEQPEQLAGILDQEVRLLSSTVATGAYLEISAAPGVQIEGAEMADGRVEDGKLRVRLGALYAGQRREVLVKVKVGGAAGESALAGVKLVYRDRAASDRWTEQSLAVRGKLSADAQAASASTDARVSAMLARHEAADAQRRASDMVNQGQDAQAQVVLRQAEVKVETAAKSAADPNERARLTAQAARMAQSREQYQSAGTASKKRAASLKSYSYSFSDDGLAPAIPAPPPPGRPVK